MLPNQEKMLSEIYTQYLNVVKPLIAEIEISYSRFPIAVLNEIRALHDHIARSFSMEFSDQKIDEQLKSAKRHSTRIILDCYKYLIIYYEDKYEKFNRQYLKINMHAIDNGDFYPKYRKLYQQSRNKFREAKRSEGQIKFEDTYSLYQNAYNAYIDLDRYVDENLSSLRWAKARFSYKSGVKASLWVVSIIITAILTNNNKEIFEAVCAWLGL